MKIAKFLAAHSLPAILLIGTAAAAEPSDSPSDLVPTPTPIEDTLINVAPMVEATYGGYSHGCRGPCAWCGNPTWTVHADAMFLHRSSPNNVVLVRNNAAATVLTAGEFNFDREGGWRIDLRRDLNPDWDLEFRYFGVDGFHATRGNVASAGMWVPYIQPTGYAAATLVSASYRSELHSLEVNTRYKMNPELDVVLGFRYVEVQDGGLVMMEDAGPGANLGTDTLDATNYLYGFQLGVDAEVFSYGQFDLQCEILTGIFGNNARNAARSTGQFGFNAASTAEADHTAFVAELGITGRYHISECWSMRAGYELLWIEGVASASDQLAVSDPVAGQATVNFNGSPFYDGLFFGFEAAW